MKMTTLILASLCAATFAFGTAQAADQKFGADRHVGMGLSCETCHGPDKANPQEPTIDTCKQCHDVKALVEKTKDELPHHARRDGKLLRPVPPVRLQGSVITRTVMQVLPRLR